MIFWLVKNKIINKFTRHYV